MKKSILYTISSLLVSFLMCYLLMSLYQDGFVLHQMSTSFIFKFVLVVLAVWIFLLAVIRIKKQNLQNNFKIYMKSDLVWTVFVLFTVILYIPSTLYLSNIEEFLVSYSKFFIIDFALFLLTTVYVATILFSIKANVRKYISAIIFAIGISIYVQSNFLNSHLPELNGAVFNWDNYKSDMYISCTVWVIIPILVILCAKFYKKSEKIMTYVAGLLFLMQLVSLVVIGISESSKIDEVYAVNKEGEFELGSDNNVILLVLDSLDSDNVKNYFIKNPEDQSQYSDFTFFTSCTGGGATTSLGMPLMLTGCEYDGVEDIKEYYENSWNDATLWKDLKEAGYDIGMYTPLSSVPQIPIQIPQNFLEAEDAYLFSDKFGFAKEFTKLVMMYEMPYPVKASFLTDTEALLANVDTREGISQYWTNTEFVKRDIEYAGKIEITGEKAFKYYHLHGVHTPYRLDENLDYLYDATFDTVFKGNLKVLTEYMNILKTAGVYDTSTIIISGDHGNELPGGIYDNPAILIKLPNESHDEMPMNTAPITLRNLYATFAKVALDDSSVYGPTIYDIDENSDQQRLHTTNNYPKEMYGENLPSAIRVIPEYPHALAEQAPIWDYKQINRVSLPDIGNGNGVIVIAEAAGIDTRVYNIDDVPMLSDEFTMYITVDENISKDVEVIFDVSTILGDEQQVKVSANGHRVGTIDYTTVELSNSEMERVIIPRDYIQDNAIYLRLTMPNAKTPKMINEESSDTRVLSIGLNRLILSEVE